MEIQVTGRHLCLNVLGLQELQRAVIPPISDDLPTTILGFASNTYIVHTNLLSGLV